MNDLFEVTLRDTPAGGRLLWEMKKDREAWRDLGKGAYVLRTNLQADSAEQMWSMYMQLTEAETSFRALKSELSIRLLFHQRNRESKPTSWCPCSGMPSFLADEGAGAALHVAECRHRVAHYR